MESSNTDKEEAYRVRKLEISDNSKGFVELLQQLTVCHPVSEQEFQKRFQEISLYGDDHVICVIEDGNSGKIIATGSVLIEKKSVRIWRIALVRWVVVKINSGVESFYEKCGYKQIEVQMVKSFICGNRLSTYTTIYGSDSINGCDQPQRYWQMLSRKNRLLAFCFI